MAKNMNSKNAFKAGIWYTIGNTVTKGINFITVPIFSRFLTQNEFGMYNNFVSWATIIATVVTLQLDATILRAKYEFEDDFSSYRWSIVVLSVIMAAACLGLTILFYPFSSRLLSMDYKYMLFMYMGMLATAVIAIYQRCQIIEYKYKSNVILSVGVAFLNIALSFIFMYFLADKLLARVLGAELSAMMIGFSIVAFYAFRAKKTNVKYWKYALTISIPFIPHLLSLNLLNSIDRVMITNFCGAEYTALYSAAYTCAIAVRVVTSSINQAFSPWLGGKIHAKQYTDVYMVSVPYVMLGGSIVIAVMLLSPELLYVIGGQPYRKASEVIIPVVVGCFCQFIYTMYVNVEQFEKKTLPMAAATMLAAVINVATNMMFIPRYGYIAAAYTTLFSYFILALIHFLLVYRLRLHILFNNRIIFFLIGLMVMTGMLITKVLFLYPIRYALLGGYTICMALFLTHMKKKYRH
jgi:Membrane protein involved in the export of O-antigen and teichoic acid